MNKLHLFARLSFGLHSRRSRQKAGVNPYEWLGTKKCKMHGSGEVRTRAGLRPLGIKRLKSNALDQLGHATNHFYRIISYKCGNGYKGHITFLVKNLVHGFPSSYTSQDASQSWLMFWSLQGISVLQVGMDPNNKRRCVLVLLPCKHTKCRLLLNDTIMVWQHPDGGFGGGPGQPAHSLPTYAAVCALAIVGRHGPGGGWDQINRRVAHLLMYGVFIHVSPAV